MAWTKTTININTNLADVGSVTATYEDATYGTFTYSEQRITADTGGKAAFATAANAAKDSWRTEQSTLAGYDSALLTALNS